MVVVELSLPPPMVVVELSLPPPPPPPPQLARIVREKQKTNFEKIESFIS
jgi:hypothetical protein